MEEINKINQFLVYYLACVAGFTQGEAAGIANGYETGQVSGRDFSAEGYRRVLVDETGISLRMYLNNLGAELNRFKGDSLIAARGVYEFLAEVKTSSPEFPEEFMLKYFNLPFMDGLALLAETEV